MFGHKLSLKWSQQISNFQKALESFKTHEKYADATLICEENFYPVHRVVLSAASDYFDKLFQKITIPNPHIVLTDVKPVFLQGLLQYMYTGETHVEQHRLLDFVKVAEHFCVKGLAKSASSEEPKKRKSSDIQELSPFQKKKKMSIDTPSSNRVLRRITENQNDIELSPRKTRGTVVKTPLVSEKTQSSPVKPDTKTSIVKTKLGTSELHGKSSRTKWTTNRVSKVVPTATKSPKALPKTMIKQSGRSKALSISAPKEVGEAVSKFPAQEAKPKTHVKRRGLKKVTEARVVLERLNVGKDIQDENLHGSDSQSEINDSDFEGFDQPSIPLKSAKCSTKISVTESTFSTESEGRNFLPLEEKLLNSIESIVLPANSSSIRSETNGTNHQIPIQCVLDDNTEKSENPESEFVFQSLTKSSSPRKIWAARKRVQETLLHLEANQSSEVIKLVKNDEDEDVDVTEPPIAMDPFDAMKLLPPMPMDDVSSPPQHAGIVTNLLEKTVNIPQNEHKPVEDVLHIKAGEASFDASSEGEQHVDLRDKVLDNVETVRIPENVLENVEADHLQENVLDKVETVHEHENVLNAVEPALTLENVTDGVEPSGLQQNSDDVTTIDMQEVCDFVEPVNGRNSATGREPEEIFHVESDSEKLASDVVSE